MDIFKLKREVEKDKPELNKVYYGDKNLMSNLHTFEEVLELDEDKNHLKHIPNDEAKFFYNNQAVKQVFTPYEDKHEYIHILAYYPFEKVYMDTMYLRLSNSTLAFVNGIDLFSKYAFSKCFTLTKSSSSVGSKRATEVFNTFLDEIKSKYPNLPIGRVYTDMGSEFFGEFQNNLMDKNIPQIFADAGNKRQSSPIERFNKTLRFYIEKYRVVYGKVDNSVLTKILLAYNNVSHADLKFSPIQILETSHDQDVVESHYIDMENSNEFGKIPLGSDVRKLINTDKSPFSNKIKPIWSKEIYKVKSYSKSLYTLNDDTIYPKDKLLTIDKDNVMGENKVKIKEEPEPIIPDDTEPVPLPIQEEPKKEPMYRLRSHTRAERNA
jgi:hypothetical protein